MVIRPLLAILLAAIPAISRAAPPAPTPPIPSKGVTRGHSISGGKEEFERALALYRAGSYAEAKPLFEIAYEASGRRASSIRALAQCERMLENDPRAIELFEEYLATTPTPADAPAIRETIVQLQRRDQARLARISAPPPRPPSSTPPPAPVVLTAAAPERPTRWAPIATVATSAALVAGGTILFILGNSAASSVEDAQAGSAFDAVRDDADRAPALMTAGVIAGSVGLAGLAAGIAWWAAGE